MEREYIVTLNPGVDYDQFWNEIENLSPADGFVPSRRVDIVNSRPGSLRNCHYALTDREAETLRQDPRVRAVEIPPDQRDDIQITPFASQSGVFHRASSSLSTYVNWGLLAHIFRDSPYSGTSSIPSISIPYTYMLDGTGVDVVIQDSGIQVDHPEFLNRQGLVTRSKLINWYANTGISAFQHPNHYRDSDGHGTHVASTVAGRVHGWAKNSDVYSLKVRGLEGGGDSGTGIVVTDCFDVIKLWHRNKPINPLTGVKRPTIVNMSWGYINTFTDISGGVYRGTPWVGTARRTDFGMIGSLRNSVYYFGNRIASVDNDIEEMIDEGIIVCIASGNDSMKIDLPGGLDYDNYFTRTGDATPVYYHRGSSPYSTRAIMVGALDSTNSGVNYQKVSFSNSGPGVDVYAVGSNVMAGMSKDSPRTFVTYPTTGLPTAPTNLKIQPGYVSSNSYISTRQVQTYENYSFASLGSRLLIGSEIYNQANNVLDAATDQGIRAGTVESGRAYRIRFEGNVDYTRIGVLNWELTFWDNNWLELLVILHQDGNKTTTDFTFDPTGNNPIDYSSTFRDTNTVSRSIVFTTNDGLNWTSNPNSRVAVVSNTITLQSGTTTQRGSTGLTLISGSVDVDEAIFPFNTPFDFIFGQTPISGRQTKLSGTSMASPQVAGIVSLYMQLDPKQTPAQLKENIIRNSTNKVRTTGLDNDYTATNTIHGGVPRVALQPWNKAQDRTSNVSINGNINFKRR